MVPKWWCKNDRFVIAMQSWMHPPHCTLSTLICDRQPTKQSIDSLIYSSMHSFIESYVYIYIYTTVCLPSWYRWCRRHARMTGIDLIGWGKVMYRPDKIIKSIRLEREPLIVESHDKRDQYNMKLHKAWQKLNVQYMSLFTNRRLPIPHPHWQVNSNSNSLLYQQPPTWEVGWFWQGGACIVRIVCVTPEATFTNMV